jgi:putative molybdopterin biosynthesis protein
VSPLHGADVATSLAAWLEAVRGAGGLQAPATEVVDLDRALGRVTAGPIRARRSTPGFDAAAMDGYAVTAASTRAAPVRLAEGAFRHVDTGDPLPPESDAVAKREDVVVDGGLRLARPVPPYANVRQVGEDVAAGDLLFATGRCLRPTDLAVLASVGETTVSVRRRPHVIVVPSGDELVPLGTEPREGQIVESNSLMLAAMVEKAGGTPTRGPIVADDPVLLAEALAAGAAEADLVLLLSGSAGGAGDHAVSVLERLGHVVVRGVAVKPGHPVVLAHCGPVPVIGVPGYPVSAALAFELFGVPLLSELSGRTVTPRPRAHATAAVELRSTPAGDEWIRLRVARLEGGLVATPLRRGAGVLSSLARADALTCVPIGSALVGAGQEIEVELLRPLAEIERSLVVSGSTDPLLGDLATRFDLVVDCDGSANGAASLVAGRCHLALVPVEDVPPGAAVLATWERTLGLVVAPGDPLAIGGADGLRRPEVRLVNRGPGSASRQLLDELLAACAVEPSAVTGYRREARSHAAVVAAVAAGVADCGVGSLSACSGQPVELIPLATQTLALAAAGSLGDDPRLPGLRAVLGQGAPPTAGSG